MFERISRGWGIAKASWAVVRQHPKLLLLPIFSGIAFLVLMAAIGVSVFAGILVQLAQGGLTTTLRIGLISAGFLWLGFVIPTMVVNYAFHGARQSLTVIDGGHWLGVLLIQGAIMGWWGVR